MLFCTFGQRQRTTIQLLNQIYLYSPKVTIIVLEGFAKALRTP